MTEPTPKEIDDLVYELRQAGTDDTYSLVCVVLAKWGQPTHSGEPVAFAFQYDDGTWHDPAITEHSSGMRPLFAAPQPVEREPLTREQVKAICAESGYETATLQERADFINGIRHAERHHNIKKGGQHGTD